AVTCPGAKMGHPLPRAMSADDIARVPELFSAAARRARAAGFDGVEIHAAHGYLLDQFLSPLTNLRKDAYGGSLGNRARLLVEVLRAVRAELPSGYPVSVRLGGCDYMPGGNTIDDAVAFARVAEAAGASLISVSGGMCYYGRPGHEDTAGWFADSSMPIRAAVGVPVLLSGGIKTGAAAEALLEQGACDLAGIGRAILNRPAWARRETTKLCAVSAPAKGTTR
ncbi:MAG: tRNA-dihydrouridine synthase, partial [Olegusella sp.]|nr:tRNA-dihydrouridine synthase [Olegusella sp.]